MKTKRTIICFLLSIICMCLFMTTFCKNTVSVTNAISSEDSILDKQDILSINSSEMTNDLKIQCDVYSGVTPFDSSTGTVMPGYSISPHTALNGSGKSYNEIKNIKFSISPFKISEGKSIYMWIYFPDDPLENWYSLTLSFEHSSNKIEWNFNPTELYNLMNDIASYRYGWKLIELPFNSGARSDNFDTNIELTQFEISYQIILSELSNELGITGEFTESSYLTNGKLSIYHMFLGNSVSNKANIALNTNYCYFSLKEDFLNELDSLIYNETYTIRQLSGMFNYVYAGKVNLLTASTQNTKFEFSYTINSNSLNNDRFPGEKFKFSDKGECSFSITLKETRYTRSMLQLEINQESKQIFKTTHSMYIGEYVFGRFNYSFFEVEKGNTYIITFKLNNDFTIQNQINFTSENDKTVEIKNIVYDTETGLYNLTVKAKATGRTNIIATATGTSSKKNNAQEYSSSTVVEVQMVASGYTELFKFLLTLVIICVSSSIVFAFFTFMNIRKNKRLQKRQ